ncbi:hypothetical protein PGT21_013543 [Puccinia graminis f. sp. tritici]|uniref:Uncharacterized protein n=1 Tax=Puccinia graminis f. sp. tritici TaxID=56615 RepID=A0A5B0QI19_PUCGR|nr:hypothetical protein PGT21_013543 [Puccinia graminis f. sp. tritici]
MYKKQTLLGPQASTGVDSSAARSRSRHGGLVRLDLSFAKTAGRERGGWLHVKFHVAPRSVEVRGVQARRFTQFMLALPWKKFVSPAHSIYSNKANLTLHDAAPANSITNSDDS